MSQLLRHMYVLQFPPFLRFTPKQDFKDNFRASSVSAACSGNAQENWPNDTAALRSLLPAENGDDGCFDTKPK